MVNVFRIPELLLNMYLYRPLDQRKVFHTYLALSFSVVVVDCKD